MAARRPFRATVYLSKAEKTALQRLAEEGGDIAEAAVIRALLRREARQRGVWLQCQPQAAQR